MSLSDVGPLDPDEDGKRPAYLIDHGTIEEDFTRLSIIIAKLIHMADNPATYSDAYIRDVIRRVAETERCRPSVAVALERYEMEAEEQRRIKRAKEM